MVWVEESLWPIKRKLRWIHPITGHINPLGCWYRAESLPSTSNPSFQLWCKNNCLDSPFLYSARLPNEHRRPEASHSSQHAEPCAKACISCHYAFSLHSAHSTPVEVPDCGLAVLPYDLDCSPIIFAQLHFVKYHHAARLQI